MHKTDQPAFLKGKDLLFCLSVITFLLLISKIPLDIVTGPQAKELKRIIKAFIAIAGCLVIASKYDLPLFNSTTRSSVSKYWMLAIPLFYPGLLSISEFSANCHAGFGGTFLFVVCFLVKGLAEEVAFRGLLQGYIAKQYPGKSNHRVCVITAIFFALIHFNNIQFYTVISVINQVIYAFFMGLLFSALMIRIGNVWLLGIAHGLLNILSTACSVTDLNQSDSLIHGSLIDHLLQIGGMVLVFSPTLLIYWFLLKGAKPRNLQVTSKD